MTRQPSLPRPMLSLCVPTHDGAKRLPALLQSLTQCAGLSSVEVVFSDNASNAATGAVIAAWRREHEAVYNTYSRSPINVGFDANIIRVVTKATGHWCWIVGDDDVLPYGAVARVLDALERCPGSIIVGDVAHVQVPTNVRTEQPSTSWSDCAVFWANEPGDIASYLAGATSVRAGFPFIGNVVFPRDAWLAQKPTRFAMTGYTHMLTLWSLVLAGTPIATRRRFIIDASSGHPERRDAETLYAVKLDLDAVSHVCRMFSNYEDRAAFRRLWAFEYPPARILSLGERCGHLPAWSFIYAQLVELDRQGRRDDTR